MIVPMLLRLIYTLLLTCVSPGLLFALLKRKSGKPHVGKRWPEYFGFTPKSDLDKPVWIHAVSVGETIAVTPLIRAIKANNPSLPILLTTTTTTGAEQATKLGDLVEHRYMPVDFSWCIRRFINIIQPRCLLIMETELWPNTLCEASSAKVPVVILNARLSERSCHRYQKFQRVFDLISSNLNLVLCQHQDDAERFIRLGINADSVLATGSIKFDINISNDLTQQSQSLRTKLGKKQGIWIAASTHQGEDEQLLEAHKHVLAANPDSLLILVPRHPERFSAVAELSSTYGFDTVTRTSQQAVTKSTQVYIGDTMGELLVLIGASDICFMAGSLIGDKVGGHNLLEPAALQKPLLNGPSYFNFSDITKQLLDVGAVRICQDSKMVAKNVIELLNDESQRKTMGSNAYQVVQLNQGAVARTINALRPFIK